MRLRRAPSSFVLRCSSFLRHLTFDILPTMSDLRKAAILLMSLPEEQAVGLLSKLAPKQVEQVSIEIAKLGRLSGDEQETVIHEFADANPNSLGLAGGGLDVAKALVEKALGSNAASTIDVVRQSIEALP